MPTRSRRHRASPDARPALAFLLALLLGPGGVAATAAPLGLPGLPDLPSLPGRAVDGVRDLDARLPDARALGAVRRTLARGLLRAHRDRLEADDDGFPFLRGRVLAFAAQAALERSARRGFAAERSVQVAGAGALTWLHIPADMDTRAALAWLCRDDPEGEYDVDHVQFAAGEDPGPLGSSGTRLSRAPPVTRAGPVATAAPDAGAARALPAQPTVRVGLVDHAVDEALLPRGAIVARQRLAGAGGNAPPSAHATAIACILARCGAPDAGGADARVKIVAVDIYGGSPIGGTSSALVEALAWLRAQGVTVVNVSLVGPRNVVVARVVASLVRAGVLIVAAVGNDGPHAAPLYPAAYDGVVGVTAVDANGRVLLEAVRGPQVDFAALGVRRLPRGQRGPSPLRGTSFAAPVVAVRLARSCAGAPPCGAADALAALRRDARDLGAPGRDDVYGDGWILGAP